MKLVLLHALPLDGSMWDPVIAQLTPDEPDEPDDRSGAAADVIVAPTLYGLGDTIESWAAAVLDLAGPGPMVVVGNSVGGSCALEVARLAGDQVRALVLVGAKAGHRPEPDLRDVALAVLGDQGVAAAWDRWWAPLFAPDADPAVVAHGRRIAIERDAADIMRGVRVFHARPDRAELIEALDIPILVVSGEHDRIPAEPAALAASLRQGSFCRVAGAGHYVPLERPASLAAIVADAVGAAGARRSTGS